MNQLIYNFLNEIEDVNKLNEISLEEFIKLVKSNNLISEGDAKLLIESFKNVVSKKSDEDIWLLSYESKLDYDIKILCTVNELSTSIKKVLSNDLNGVKIILVIGPEGGFTDLEEKVLNKKI